MVFFAENSDWLKVASSGLFDDSADFSMYAWIKPSSAQVAGTPVVFGFVSSTAPTVDYYVIIFDTVFWNLYYNNVLGEFNSYAIATKDNNVWSFIGVTRAWNGVTWQQRAYYKNASALGSTGWTFQLDTEFIATKNGAGWDSFVIGSLYGSAGTPYRGDVRHCRVVGGELTDAQMWEEMMRSAPVLQPTAGAAKAAWPLHGVDYRDFTGLGNTLVKGSTNDPVESDTYPPILTNESITPRYQLAMTKANAGVGAVEFFAQSFVAITGPVNKAPLGAVEFVLLSFTVGVGPVNVAPLGAVEFASLGYTPLSGSTLFAGLGAVEFRDLGFAPAVGPSLFAGAGALEFSSQSFAATAGPLILTPPAAVEFRAFEPALIVGSLIMMPLGSLEFRPFDFRADGGTTVPIATGFEGVRAAVQDTGVSVSMESGNISVTVDV